MPKLRPFAQSGPKVDRRTHAGRLMSALRQELVVHVGGRPSATQAAVIERICWLAVHLARLDERAVEEGGLSDHAARQYLAWANTQARLLRQLGMEAPPAPKRTVTDLLAERRAPAE